MICFKPYIIRRSAHSRQIKLFVAANHTNYTKSSETWNLSVKLSLYCLNIFHYYLLLGNTNTSILNDSSLCSGLSDGNYELRINGALFPMNFLSCVAGIPYCRFCPDPNGPLLYYTPACDQCLSLADFSKCSIIFIFCILYFVL